MKVSSNHSFTFAYVRMTDKLLANCSQMIIAQLPQELLDLVIDYAGPSNWANTALTARAWRRRSQVKLFQAITISSPECLHALEDLLHASPSLLDHVSRLSLGPTRRRHGDNYDDLIDYLKSLVYGNLKLLRRIQFSGLCIDHFALQEFQYSLPDFLSRFSTLDELEFRECELHMTTLPCILTPIPTLSLLHIWDCAEYEYDDEDGTSNSIESMEGDMGDMDDRDGAPDTASTEGTHLEELRSKSEFGQECYRTLLTSIPSLGLGVNELLCDTWTARFGCSILERMAQHELPRQLIYWVLHEDSKPLYDLLQVLSPNLQEIVILSPERLDITGEFAIMRHSHRITE